MRFLVPQDVQREDQIIGTITFKQLAILLLGGGITYAFYLLLYPIYTVIIWAPVVGFFALLTLAIAFLRIFDMSFTMLILSLIEYLFKPRMRHFHKRNLVYNHAYSKDPLLFESSLDKKKIEAKSISQDSIEDLSKLLDK